MHADLLDLPYFEGIELSELIGLVDLMSPVEFEKGQTILREGDAAPPLLHIATNGRVTLSKINPAGETRSIAQLDSPTLFGEIEFFCQIPAVCSTVAQTRVSAFTLDRKTFKSLYDTRHRGILAFTFNVARVACHRLAIADEMLTHVLEGEDLCNLRRTVFAQMNTQGLWRRTTGAFKVPKF
jgi:CRP-like cAMP-binding protein